MKEPMRWMDEGSDAPTGLAELLRRAEPTRIMSEVERAQSLAMITELAATKPPGGSAALTVKKILTWILCLSGSGLLFSGGVLAHGIVVQAVAETRSEAPTIVRVEEEARPSVEVMTPGIAPPTPPATARPPKRPASTKTAPIRAPSPKPEDTLVQETGLLGEGQRALSTRPSEALDWAETHGQFYPNGQLAAERETLAIDALVRLGRRAEAYRRAEALLEREKGSVYEERARRKLTEIQGLLDAEEGRP